MGNFSKTKNVLLCTRLYKYAPNLESLLTQQYVCIMCTLWSDNTCVLTRFHSVKHANMQLIWSSDGHHRRFLFLIGLFLKIFSSETVKPHGQMIWNLVGSIYGKSSYKDCSFCPNLLTNIAATDNSCFWLVDF